MSDQNIQDRFEELEAGRILGDLSIEEMAEWQELSETYGFSPDFSLELAAAAIETDFLQSLEQGLPTDLSSTLRRNFPKNPQTSPNTASIVVTPVWQRIIRSPQIPWSIAACFALLFAISSLTNPQDSESTADVADMPADSSPKQGRDQLLAKAVDLFESEFSGTESYNGMSGKVVWSDELQEGYMTLTDLPVNDSSENQYQLWIVDPDRDEKPVDGGVFDIPQGESTAIIPIRNPLLVTKPQAFVITLEQPGGVVVSKQEAVVAIAKAS